jgi:hypothetical protein
MNMILHGIETPNIIHKNTLTENLADIQEKDRYEVVMANPPFGGKERKEVQQKFPMRTGETAFPFLQHFIKMLKAGGRGGVVNGLRPESSRNSERRSSTRISKHPAVSTAASADRRSATVADPAASFATGFRSSLYSEAH